MDRTGIINKPVDLDLLTTELKAKSAKVSGLSLNGDVTLTVYGADDLTDADITASVTAHVKPIKIDPKQVLKDDIDAASFTGTPQMKAILKRVVDLR